jgi:hypothetical protein
VISADPCTGARKTEHRSGADSPRGVDHGQSDGARVHPRWSGHRGRLVAPDESARSREVTLIWAVARRSRYVSLRFTSRDLRRASQEPHEEGTGGCRDRGPFIADAYADWCKHGIEALQRMRVNDPSGYVRVIAGILPDKLEVDVKHAVTRIERVIVDHRPQRDVTPTLPQEQPKLIEHNNINSLADADS